MKNTRSELARVLDLPISVIFENGFASPLAVTAHKMAARAGKEMNDTQFY